MIGVSSYKLGLAYERANQSETAIKYLNIYKNACTSTKDMDGLGTAYSALARSLQWWVWAGRYRVESDILVWGRVLEWGYVF